MNFTRTKWPNLTHFHEKRREGEWKRLPVSITKLLTGRWPPRERYFAWIYAAVTASEEALSSFRRKSSSRPFG